MFRLFSKENFARLFLFLAVSVYPLLYLYSRNPEFVSWSEFIKPYFGLGLALVTLLIPLLLLIKPARLAWLAASGIFLLFFSYFSLNFFISSWQFEGAIQPAIYSLGILLGLMGIWLAILLHIPKTVQGWLWRVFNFMVLFLLLLSFFRILSHNNRNNFQPSEDMVLQSLSVEDLPDIFWIITDGHARTDVAQGIYGADLYGFTKYLKDKGFYIVDKSTANYPKTYLSLASTLNMNYLPVYLPNVSNSFVNDAFIEGDLYKLLDHFDYQIVSFATGHAGIELWSADQRLKAPKTLTELQASLINLTPFRDFTPEWVDYYKQSSHKNRIAYTLEVLPELVQDNQRPKFVMAHIIIPHPPFIFNENGKQLPQTEFFNLVDGISFTDLPGESKDTYKNKYVDQLKYTDKLLMRLVNDLLASISRPTVIILQSDHGPGMNFDDYNLTNSDLAERFRNFSAIYYSDNDYSDLWPTLSNVNTFRLVANKYFLTTLEELPDKSYFLIPTSEQAGVMVDVTSQVDN